MSHQKVQTQKCPDLFLGTGYGTASHDTVRIKR